MTVLTMEERLCWLSSFWNWSLWLSTLFFLQRDLRDTESTLLRALTMHLVGLSLLYQSFYFSQSLILIVNCAKKASKSNRIILLRLRINKVSQTFSTTKLWRSGLFLAFLLPLTFLNHYFVSIRTSLIITTTQLCCLIFLLVLFVTIYQSCYF